MLIIAAGMENYQKDYAESNKKLCYFRGTVCDKTHTHRQTDRQTHDDDIYRT